MDSLIDMTTKNIIQSLDWDSIFGNSSQTDNLYDLLKGDIDLDVFITECQRNSFESELEDSID